ncbi:hypothetical protein JOD55_000283 [Arcanobacterium pluranimalium]|uniref:hypothetical protein n=1 Tax=Arcanobacterium pluranimalium TaxID=108028 RepID=UPI001959F8C3|nr:hypothetical protein [Arcanobacterium pluranimalium]MBM7824456.1 hypothetical protein [Arcanobacterium pluranimalium]
MDDLRGDPTDPNAAPYRFPAKWFEIVDDDCSAWVSQFYYFSAEKISGKPAYVRSYRAHDFYERMHTGELSYLAILRLTYPPSTWHYDRTGIDDSIERWMSEFTEE